MCEFRLRRCSSSATCASSHRFALDQLTDPHEQGNRLGRRRHRKIVKMLTNSAVHIIYCI